MHTRNVHNYEENNLFNMQVSEANYKTYKLQLRHYLLEYKKTKNYLSYNLVFLESGTFSFIK